MGRVIGCLGVLSVVIGSLLVVLGLSSISNPGLTPGYLTPAPVDWGKVWGYIVVGGVLILGPVGFFTWTGISIRREHPGMTLTQAVAAEEAKAAASDAERAGYVKVNDPEQHCTQCPTPRFTGQKADVRVGIGSVWECRRCHRRWVLVEHEREVSMYRTRTSRWRPATTGE